MMRPVSVAMQPNKPDGLGFAVTGNGNGTRLTVTWNDNSLDETSFLVQRKEGTGQWVDAGTLLSPLDANNDKGARSLIDSTYRRSMSVEYRVIAQNTVGYAGSGGAFKTVTTQGISDAKTVVLTPTNLTATAQAGPQVGLAWTDNATNETGFTVQRSTNGGPFGVISLAPARSNTGGVTFVDTGVVLGNTYDYRVAATAPSNSSAPSNVATVIVDVPAAATDVVAANGANQGSSRRVVITWTDNATNETGFTLQRATNASFTAGVTNVTIGANVQSYTAGSLSRGTDYYFRIRVDNALGSSGWVTVTPLPIHTNP